MLAKGDFVMSKIIYQMALRTFTPQGTISAATERLAHVASLGVDIVYLCPFFVQENDPDKAFWSQRQLASQTGNPKNPYKIADYFGIDEEYGTAKDLKQFVKKAHRLGLAVMFDLVYLHCGRSAVFLAEHPDFVERNEDGSIKVPDRWPFARLNFQNPALREYLIAHMLWLVTEFGADGFRCDVGDSVPLDFWQEAFTRVRAVKPDLITMNEGHAARHMTFFDMGYSFRWNKIAKAIFEGKEPPEKLFACHKLECETYGTNNILKMSRMTDNHDLASDVGINRNELVLSPPGVEAFLTLTYAYPGVPFLWNGCEFSDTAENCMFSSRDHGKRSAMDWSRAFTPAGKRRLTYIRSMHRLYHSSEALQRGTLCPLNHSAQDAVIAFLRQTEQETVLVMVNTRRAAVSVNLTTALSDTTPLLHRGASVTAPDCVRLSAYGYLIAKIGQ